MARVNLTSLQCNKNYLVYTRLYAILLSTTAHICFFNVKR